MIRYAINSIISAEQFIEVLQKSGLAERRPVDDVSCIKGMVENANLTVTAWHEGTLIGVARSLTDFHYACYLSDLAVDKKYQHQGIGKKLMTLTQEQLGPRCKLILFAAPAADSYYEKIGFTRNSRGWVLERNQRLDET
jgi:ribosomal protein S18 acetylase RimI-like enzyme